MKGGETEEDRGGGEEGGRHSVAKATDNRGFSAICGIGGILKCAAGSSPHCVCVICVTGVSTVSEVIPEVSLALTCTYA